jgi:hypothetical protein
MWDRRASTTPHLEADTQKRLRSCGKAKTMQVPAMTVAVSNGHEVSGLRNLTPEEVERIVALMTEISLARLLNDDGIQQKKAR